MFYQILLSSQVKRCVITTYKHGIYELPHELPNDLRLSEFGECCDLFHFEFKKSVFN